MHFWIDKRSQAYGYGRSRAGFVAASLGNGFDFYHPPRRFGHESMVPPSNRFASAECRPHWNRPGVHRPNVARTNHQSERFHPPAQPRVHQVVAHMLAEANSYESREHTPHIPAIQQCRTHMPIDIEQGTMDMNSIRPTTHDVLSDDHSNVTDTVNAIDPLLPMHLRFGMWTSLALATFILAAFLGRILEVLIFYAFSAAFFLIAYPMALCRQPRTININAQQLPTIPTEPISIDIEQIPQMDRHHSHVVVNGTDPVTAPPPPYHIAILTTENPKANDDSPPPSYDKIIM